jgi:WD40 repeat protein
LRGPPLTAHRDQVTSLTYSPDRKVLASGSADGTVRFWDPARQSSLGALVNVDMGHVWAVAFSPNGKILAVAGDDTGVQLWDVARRRVIASLLGHTSGVYSLAFSPDGTALASAGADRTVRLWDVASGQPLGLPLQGHSANHT